MLSNKYYDAIIVCGIRERKAGPVRDANFLKYHNIKGAPGAVKSFMRFAQGQKNAQYVNFYDRETEQFCVRLYFED